MYGYWYVVAVFILVSPGGTHWRPSLISIDFGDKQITVNCIAPGGIKTDMYHKVCREYIPNGENLDDDQVDEVKCSSQDQNDLSDINSTLQPGVHCTALAFQSILLVSSASWLVRMANGSMVRSSVSMVLL